MTNLGQIAWCQLCKYRLDNVERQCLKPMMVKYMQSKAHHYDATRSNEFSYYSVICKGLLALYLMEKKRGNQGATTLRYNKEVVKYNRRLTIKDIYES